MSDGTHPRFRYGRIVKWPAAAPRCRCRPAVVGGWRKGGPDEAFAHSFRFAFWAALLLSLAVAGTVLAGGRPISVAMTGAAERPDPGDPDGSGTAAFTFNQGEGEVCFWLSVEDILVPASAAHIHVAPPTDPGPVVIGLAAPDANGVASGCVSADPALIKAIRKNPGNYYVNVHNSEYPNGAVRAQLSK